VTPDPVVSAWRRLARELAGAGHERAALAAAVLVCRGRLRLDPAAFARWLGIPPVHVEALEAGARPPSTVPRRLAQLAPELDWPAVGVDLGAADRAARHPAGGGVGGARAGHPP
jgi:hypothetical protein